MRSIRRRRRISMTSLVDVIFLLLLFFMLTSTFTRFAEVELTSGGGGTATAETRPLFLQVAPDRLSLNGAPVALEELAEALAADDATAPRPLLVALRGEVTAQRLTDLLVVLRGVPGVQATVLGAS
ncbi:biopolymer transporter ExbD [Rhodosalinus sp.]|uniref:biopolymer transporter ExbD n=1 Tax=Rhodosalinus sp. TaxID=2047741 RepID=UPI00397DA4C8